MRKVVITTKGLGSCQYTPLHTHTHKLPWSMLHPQSHDVVRSPPPSLPISDSPSPPLYARQLPDLQTTPHSAHCQHALYHICGPKQPYTYTNAP